MRCDFRTSVVAVAVALAIGTSAHAANPDRDAYFGETHVHTSWSLDAWLFGNRITDPGDAYKYFKGETIKHPLGYDIKIHTPLDWAGVTDHSEYVGVIKFANDPKSPVNKLAAAQPLPEQLLRSLQHLVGLRRSIHARDLANEQNRRFDGRREVVCHGRLRASGGIARDGPGTAQHSRQGSKTAAGREHGATAARADLDGENAVVR